MYKMSNTSASFTRTRGRVRRGFDIAGTVGIHGLGLLAMSGGLAAGIGDSRNAYAQKKYLDDLRAAQEAEYSANLHRAARFTGWQRQGRVYGRALGTKALAAATVGLAGAGMGYLGGRAVHPAMYALSAAERRKIDAMNESLALGEFEDPENM